MPTTVTVQVPVVKLKIKYGEDEQELLPPSLRVEGGRYCEARTAKLDSGRAKLKLRSSERVELALRGVPLDKEGRQEVWVPEFLFTIQAQDCPDGEKWSKAVVTPAMPE